MLYRVYLINFGFYLQDMYLTFEDAVAKGRSTGFEFRIDLYFPKN